MCAERRQTPCHPRCPNAEPERPVYFCDGCGKGIYDGEEYYPLFSERYCVECIEGNRKTAERCDWIDSETTEP